MSWRLADSLQRLRDQINAAFPYRSKVSDGTIGDAAHQKRASDHNPNADGVVCAMDITHSPETGLDAHALADQLRLNRHPNLKYIISNRRIAGAWTNWAWWPYSGENPHTAIVHVSVGEGDDGKSKKPYDDKTDWAVNGGAARKSNDVIADEVIAGKWGNGDERRQGLEAHGFDYAAIQSAVNRKLGGGGAAPRKSNQVIADEVMAGAWGNGSDRKAALEAAGYDYAAVQDEVNKRVGTVSQTDDQIADQVIAGAWGNGDERRARLAQAGFSYDKVQAAVNRKLGTGEAGKKSDDQIANEVIAGKWGKGQERKDSLAKAGYDYAAVQKLVNQKLGY